MRNTVIAALLAGATLASSAHAADLMDVYRKAVANDPVIASARAALDATEERIPQSRAGLLPAIGLEGTTTSTQAAAPTGDFSSERYSLALQQPLFRLVNWEQYQQSKLVVAASTAQFAQAQQDLILRVSEAYFQVLVAQDTLSSILAQKEAISEQLAFAKRNFEVGIATITDTHEAQARFDLIQAQELAARNNLAIARSALRQITGQPVEELAELRPSVELSPPQPSELDPWVDSAQRQNFLVVAQELTMEAARREIRKNRAAHAPTVDLVAARDYSDRSGLASMTGNSVGLRFNFPLFAGFAISSRVDEAIALHDKARSDLETVRRSAAQAARQAYFGVTSGLGQIKALEAAEVSSLSALEANRLGYQVGVRINIDVLNAQQQLFLTRRDLSQARYNTLLNSLRLKAAAGTLGEEDVQQVNALLGNTTGNQPK